MDRTALAPIADESAPTGALTDGQKKALIRGPLFLESQAARLDSFSPRVLSLTSVDGVERVVTDLANDAAGGPARRDGYGREMISLRHIDQAFALWQAPVIQ